MRFTELLRLDRAEQRGATDAARIADLFQQVAAEAGMRHWRPGRPVQSRGWRVLIGAAPSFSAADLIFLDRLAEAVATNPGDVVVDVFSIEDLDSKDAVFKYFPRDVRVSFASWRSTPLVGVWSNGRLVSFGQQAHGIDLAFDILGVKGDGAALVEEALAGSFD